MYSGRGKYNARGKYSAAGDFAQNDSLNKKISKFFFKKLKIHPFVNKSPHV